MHKQIHKNKKIDILNNFCFNDFESSLNAKLNDDFEEIEESDTDI
jgi:hypothetical protein